MSTNTFVEAGTRATPYLETLIIGNCFRNTQRPTHYRWLEPLQNLKHLQLSGSCLASDSLLYLSPSIKYLKFQGKVLTAAECGSCLAGIDVHSGLTIHWEDSGYGDRDLDLLAVRFSLFLAGTWSDTPSQAICSRLPLAETAVM